LLSRLAPFCDRYEGIDLSQTGLDFIRQRVDQDRDKFPGVSLSRRSADELSVFPLRSFDTLVLNSVVQYFPNVEYLAMVLKNAVELIQDGGNIFIGDVRNLALLEAFHTAVQLHQASEDTTIKDLSLRVRQRVDEEQELLIHPSFFHALQHQVPRITDVQIRLKSGRHHNEITQFRYDVILRIGGETCPQADCRWLNWQNDVINVERLREILAQNCDTLAAVSDIPNARTWEAVSAWRISNEKGDSGTVAELRKEIIQHPLPL